MSRTRRTRLADGLALEPNVVAVSAAMFLMGLGENLWRRFLPKYLELLGAPITAIGLFGTTEGFLDGVYQYPGGWVADRFGRRLALLERSGRPRPAPVSIERVRASFAKQAFMRLLGAEGTFTRFKHTPVLSDTRLWKSGCRGSR